MLFGASVSFAQPGTNSVRCGEVITVKTHDGSTTRYSLASPTHTSPQSKAIVLVLLVGGNGYLNLDDAGCPRSLKGNSLVRSIEHFRAAGFFTALVDAPSTHHDVDGLEGFRTHAQHAEDLGKVLADIQARTKGNTWLAGTSRGAISAVNAASRLTRTGRAHGGCPDVASHCRPERSKKGMGGAIGIRPEARSDHCPAACRGPRR